MASNLDKLKWDLYKEKTKILFNYGITHGLIKPYDEEFITRLRNYYYGGIPLSILILTDKLCNGYCYDRALLPPLAFGDDNFNIVHADIDEIKFNPEIIDRAGNIEHYSNHCFVERIMSDGTTLIYDTSKGLVYDKRLYYLMENPKVTLIRSKQETLDFCEYQELLHSPENLEKDMNFLSVFLPIVESLCTDSKNIYSKALSEEFELFKEKIESNTLFQECETGFGPVKKKVSSL